MTVSRTSMVPAYNNSSINGNCYSQTVEKLRLTTCLLLTVPPLFPNIVPSSKLQQVLVQNLTNTY